MKHLAYLTLAYLAIALTLVIGAGFAVYDTMKSPRRGSAQN